MKGRSDKNLAGFAIVALLIGGLGGLAVVGWNRQERDYALTDAVGRRDIPAIRKLLEAGASPNARWSGYRLQDRLGCVFQRTDLCAAFESYTVWDRVQGDVELVTLIAVSEQFGYLPALAATASDLLTKLRSLWPPETEMPIYPPFRTTRPNN